MTRSETSKIVFMLAATLQHQSGSIGDVESLVAGWHLALEDVDYPDAEAAVRVYLRTGKWFPAPSEIRNLVAKRVLNLPDAPDAWTMVLRHLRDYHPVNAHPFDGPEAVKLAVAAMGGFHTLRMSEHPEKDRDQFMRVYPTYLRRAEQETDLRSVPDALPERTLQ